MYLNLLVVFLDLHTDLIMIVFVLIDIDHELIPSVPELLLLHRQVVSFGTEVGTGTTHHDLHLIERGLMPSQYCP